MLLMLCASTKTNPSFTVGPIMFTSDLLWQYSVFPAFPVHMLCSCWWHIQKPCKSLWCWCWEWNYGKNVPRCSWADCRWLFVSVLVWGLPNSGALVMEEHWASGLMKYPGDPASEGLEFITHVPSLHGLTPLIKWRLQLTHGEKYRTEAESCLQREFVVECESY